MLLPEHSINSAGLVRRLVCAGYEAILLLALLSVTVLLPHMLLGAFAHRVATATILWAHTFLVLLVYFQWFWRHGGQTLAMKTWKIRLTTRTGQAVRPAVALLRYVLCWLSLILCGTGFLWALVDPERQFLHDRLAGTRLIEAN